MRTLIFILLSLVTISTTAKNFNVLYIGNSYTATNNLPGIIYSMALTTLDTITYSSRTPGGYTLKKHSADAATISLIQAGNWDYVVLQEQSQLPATPDSYFYTEGYPYAEYLDSLVHVYSPCAETIFYQTWGRENGDPSNCAQFAPFCTYEGMDSMLQLRYRTMAQDFGTLIAPVGDVWHRVRDLYYPSVQPYSSDGSHPSDVGSYIAAVTLYTMITERNPSTVNYNHTLAAQTASDIQNVAKELVYDSLIYHIYVDRTTPTVDTIEFSQLSQDSVYVYSNATYASQTIWILGSDTLLGAEVMMYYDSLEAHDWQVQVIVSNCYGEDSYTSPPLSLMYKILPHTSLLYPNPSQGDAYIYITDGQTKHIQVYSLTGELIYHAVSRLERFTLPAAEWSPGSYLVHVRDSKTGEIQLHLLIKQ